MNGSFLCIALIVLIIIFLFICLYRRTRRGFSLQFEFDEAYSGQKKLFAAKVADSKGVQSLVPFVAAVTEREDGIVVVCCMIKREGEPSSLYSVEVPMNGGQTRHTFGWDYSTNGKSSIYVDGRQRTIMMIRLKEQACVGEPIVRHDVYKLRFTSNV